MIKKLLTAGAAVAAVLAFAPAAGAVGPAAALDVGPNSSGGPYTVNAVNKGSVSVTLGSLALSCSSASASGGATPSTGFSNPYNYIDFTSTVFTGCIGPGGVPMVLTQTCDLEVSTTTAAIADVAVTDEVDSTLTVGAGCLHAEDGITGEICDLDIVGTVGATYKETDKGGGVQDLVISGSGLELANVVGCADQVADQDPVTFDLTFNITSTTGLLNFKD